MTYVIDARLERGAPSLTLIDAITGEERLNWRGENSANGDDGWKELFKRLMLLSCADRINLVAHGKSLDFGEQCVDCSACVDHTSPISRQDKTEFTACNVVQLADWRKR